MRQCKLKWTTLRNCYARLLREERSHKVKKRHWHLRNEMNFLRDHIQPYTESRLKLLSKRTNSLRCKISKSDNSTTNCSIDQNSFTSSIIEQQKDCSSNDLYQNPQVPEFIIEETNEQCNNTNNNNWEQEENLPENNETLNFSPVIKINPFSLSERINESSEDTFQPKNKNEQSESNSLFLRSLLADLNKLSGRKQRIFKRKTLEVLEDLFNEGEYDIPRDESNVRQCQLTRSNYNFQQQQAVIAEKFVHKTEPTSP
ncbi:uncharacterized protein LOC129909112 isoform X2 [Episyrphus balteatus]|uniref:uncharacterized protein LOC129909112 isoform X2 n=1 Tax=Episyrphus balteatus TaxID=286459 RepID=UPI002485FC47|nr:uncharacterized protein LOC129909112 isoform X2 [Episyrphus balteatus]